MADRQATGEYTPLMVPDIGDAEQIELITWNAEPGDEIYEGQELCELVTDKASFPLESPFNGKLVSIERQAGDPVEIGDVLAYIQPALQGDAVA